MALVYLGCEGYTSCPISLAFSTNHHHEPAVSTAIFVPVGSLLRILPTVDGSLERRYCDGAFPSLKTPSCVTLLWRSTPAYCSIEWSPLRFVLPQLLRQIEPGNHSVYKIKCRERRVRR